MNKYHVSQGALRPHLANGLQKGLRLNIAHSAADLTDDHVHMLLRHGVDPRFDFIGDMGNDLNCGAQVVPPALTVQYRPVDLAGGDGAVAGEILVYKPLVVAQVQICLGAVLGDKDLSMLIGTHGAGVYINIGIKFLVSHPDAPLF